MKTRLSYEGIGHVLKGGQIRDALRKEATKRGRVTGERTTDRAALDVAMNRAVGNSHR